MSGGFEWSGYASQPLSGVPEALDAAGVGSTIVEDDGGEDDSHDRQRWWDSREAPLQMS